MTEEEMKAEIEKQRKAFQKKIEASNEKLEALEKKLAEADLENKSFKKQAAEIEAQRKENSKLELFKEMGFDEKHFNKLSKLTNEIDEAKLKSELESDDYSIFKESQKFSAKIIADPEQNNNNDKKEKPLDEELNDYFQQQGLI